MTSSHLLVLNCSSKSVSISGLEPGLYTLYIQAEDIAGNVAPEVAVRWTVGELSLRTVMLLKVCALCGLSDAINLVIAGVRLRRSVISHLWAFFVLKKPNEIPVYLDQILSGVQVLCFSDLQEEWVIWSKQ